MTLIFLAALAILLTIQATEWLVVMVVAAASALASLAAGRGRMPRPSRQFTRPSIDLNRTGREWHDANPYLLEPGDVVANHGVVHSVHRSEREVVVECGQDRTLRARPGQTVWAHARRPVRT